MAARKKKDTRVIVQLSHGVTVAHLHTSKGKIKNGEPVELPADEAALLLERGLVIEPGGDDGA